MRTDSLYTQLRENLKKLSSSRAGMKEQIIAADCISDLLDQYWAMVRGDKPFLQEILDVVTKVMNEIQHKRRKTHFKRILKTHCSLIVKTIQRVMERRADLL